MDLAALFPDDDYRFQMRLERGAPREFFGRTAGHGEIISEREHWLGASPTTYAAFLEECAPLLDETADLLREWEALSDDEYHSLKTFAPGLERGVALGRILEPDYLILKPGVAGAFELLGGCVCFPSSWDLAEKIGRPLEFIHDAVPGLNAQIGKSIHAFLGKLAPGIAWQRSNWGLTRDAELNHHASRRLPRLDASVSADDVWLRVERQALVALPRNRGVLFGIRIALHSLADVKRDPCATNGLQRALKSMPDAVAAYKGISTARERILALLDSAT